MNGVDLRALLKRLEELEGPDTQVDAALDAAFHGPPRKDCETCGSIHFRFASSYTRSTDDALKLVSEALPHHEIILRTMWSGGWFAAVRQWGSAGFRKDDTPLFDAESRHTGAIALCKALVSALIAKAEAEEGVGG